MTGGASLDGEAPPPRGGRASGAGAARTAGPFFEPPVPRLIAHRGASGEAPENTLPAFRRAVERGAEMIELDLHLSSDGVPVVLHDETLERTTDAAGPVAARTAAELACVDAGHRFSPDGGRTWPFRGTGVGVPTLRDVLEDLPRVRLTLEVKTADPAIDGALRRLLRSTAAEERVLLAAHDGPVVRRIRSSFPDLPTNVASDEVAAFLAGAASPRGASAFQVPPRYRTTELVTRGFVAAAHAAGLEVHVWTVNDPAEMHALLDLGVDGILTDFPERLLAVYRSRGAR